MQGVIMKLIKTLFLVSFLWVTTRAAQATNKFFVFEHAEQVSCDCACKSYHVYETSTIMIKEVKKYKCTTKADQWWYPFALLEYDLSLSNTLHIQTKAPGLARIFVIHTSGEQMVYNLHILPKNHAELANNFNVND